MSTEAMRKALEAMDALIERGSATKVALDADIPNGEPVHPLSAALTWPLAVAKGAANDLRTALAAPEPKAEAMVRFCPGCGSVGPVPETYRDCCPDGKKARMIPASLAAHCHDLFQLALEAAPAAPPQPQPEQAAQAQAGQAVEEIGGVPVTWWQQDGCRNRHYTPENIGAIIADLKECEQGREVPEWVYRDHRGRCGVLWRVMSALYYGIDPAAPSQPEAGLVGLTECHGLDTPDRVCFYEQDFYVLSNFSSFNLVWEGFTFQTSEAAYHWEKFANENDDDTRNSLAYAIYEAPSAHEAFKLAEANKGLRRKDWDDVKVGIMRDILRAKAAQHEYVSRKLLATGDRELVENSWRDDFWGWGPNRDGQNMLGKLWMEIRAELHAAKAEGER